MRIAHVRERHAPAGAPWRLAAADPSGAAGAGRPHPLDRPRARPPASRRRPSRAGPRQRPPPPAADDPRRPARARHARGGVAGPGRGLRGAGRRRPGPPRDGRPRLRSAGAPTAFHPRLLRLRGARPHDVGAPRWRGPGGLVPAADLLLQQRLRGPRTRRSRLGAGRVVGAGLRARGRGADRHARRRPRRRRRGGASAATRSSTTGRRATSSARRRPSGSGRRRARTSRARSDRGS